SETRRPEAATTCAMPPPICPAPTTSTCSNLTRENLLEVVAAGAAVFPEVEILRHDRYEQEHDEDPAGERELEEVRVAAGLRRAPLRPAALVGLGISRTARDARV